MIKFREDLQKEIIDTIDGMNLDIESIDKKFYDQPVDKLPFVVVTVRQMEYQGPGEMGVNYDLYNWLVHIYYIDIADDFDTGSDKRDENMGAIIKYFEEHRTMDGFRSNDSGHEEYIWDGRISSCTFDQSGQEEYYTFVSELHIMFDTARR